MLTDCKLKFLMTYIEDRNGRMEPWKDQKWVRPELLNLPGFELDRLLGFLDRN